MKTTMKAVAVLSFATLLASAASRTLENPLGEISIPLASYAEGVVSTITDYGSKALSYVTETFDSFKKTFNKVYNSVEEEEERIKIFIENQKNIFNWNNITNLPFILKLNEYADLLTDEFNKLVNGLVINREESKGSSFTHNTAITIPDHVDWREEGAVTPVRHQGQCASCYAFAAVAALESHMFKKSGKLESLSPQNIIDCTEGAQYKNSGCNKGSVDFAFDFIKDNGINTEISYPYEEKAGQQCRHKRDANAATIKGYVLLDEGDERGLEEALATKGPVAAGIDAHARFFQFYGSGIYYEPTCNSSVDHINHAVLVVGFGTEADGQKYWLIKNSYGTAWGENGYAKIARNVTNHCGIATYALYPEV